MDFPDHVECDRRTFADFLVPIRFALKTDLRPATSIESREVDPKGSLESMQIPDGAFAFRLNQRFATGPLTAGDRDISFAGPILPGTESALYLITEQVVPVRLLSRLVASRDDGEIRNRLGLCFADANHLRAQVRDYPERLGRVVRAPSGQWVPFRRSNIITFYDSSTGKVLQPA